MAEQRLRFVDGKAGVHVWHHRVDVVDRAGKITGVFVVEAQLCGHLRDTRAVATLDPFGDAPMKKLAAGRRYASRQYLPIESVPKPILTTACEVGPLNVLTALQEQR